MPARRKSLSVLGKPVGPMMAASKPRHAQARSIVPVFCGISGW